MAKAEGRYCCECDYCAVSPCGPGGAYTIFLTDYYPGPSFDYYSFCEQHRLEAMESIERYIAVHPGVKIAPEEK